MSAVFVLWDTATPSIDHSAQKRECVRRSASGLYAVLFYVLSFHLHPLFGFSETEMTQALDVPDRQQFKRIIEENLAFKRKHTRQDTYGPTHSIPIKGTRKIHEFNYVIWFGGALPTLVIIRDRSDRTGWIWIPYQSAWVAIDRAGHSSEMTIDIPDSIFVCPKCRREE